MTRLPIEDIRSALTGFFGVFGLLIACVLMATKDVAAITSPAALSVMAVISALAAVADVIIRYRRRKNGITEQMLLAQVRADIDSGRSPFSPTGNRWVLVAISVVTAIVSTLAGLYFGGLPT